MLGTAFFFSWEENWGTQCPFLASPTLPHARAALAALRQCAFYFDRTLHKITSCAELCTISCVQYSLPILLSTAQLPIPFLQNSAYARALRNLEPTRSRHLHPLLASFKARNNMQNRSRARLALYPLRLKGTSSLAFQTTPHASAALVLYAQRTSHPGRRPDQVTRHAKACATTHAQDHCFIPQHIELLFLSPFQNAALARKLYNSASTCSRYKQPRLSSFAVCESVHDRSRTWRALYPPGVNIYSVEDTLKRPHVFAALVTQLQCVLYLGGPSHQVTRRAKACTAALAQDFHLTPQSEEKVTVIFLKSAAHKGGLSNLGPADQKLGRCLPSSYTAQRRAQPPTFPAFIPSS